MSEKQETHITWTLDLGDVYTRVSVFQEEKNDAYMAGTLKEHQPV